MSPTLSVTIHSVTYCRWIDRRTDRRQYHANSRSYCVQQYDRLRRVFLVERSKLCIIMYGLESKQPNHMRQTIFADDGEWLIVDALIRTVLFYAAYLELCEHIPIIQLRRSVRTERNYFVFETYVRILAYTVIFRSQFIVIVLILYYHCIVKLWAITTAIDTVVLYSYVFWDTVYSTIIAVTVERTKHKHTMMRILLFETYAYHPSMLHNIAYLIQRTHKDSASVCIVLNYLLWWDGAHTQTVKG